MQNIGQDIRFCLSLLLVAAATPMAPGCSSEGSGGGAPTEQHARPPVEEPVWGYRVIRSYPHDPQAFTQGLVFHGGALYEGTGLYGRSSLREVELETGKVRRSVALEPEYFGEGITLFGTRVIQLTWQEGVGFLYEAETFRRIGRFSFPREGWGLTHDGQRLIASDGTSTLYFLDPHTLHVGQRLKVHGVEGPVTRLNELEWRQGEILANVWQTDRIVRISPLDGEVLGWIDLKGLLAPEDRRGGVDVLNGIAYDPVGDRLFVTGKLWPKLFEIELIEGE